MGVSYLSYSVEVNSITQESSWQELLILVLAEGVILYVWELLFARAQ